MDGLRRSINTPIHKKAKMVKSVTEKASDPGSTRKTFPLTSQYMADTDQATPMPRNTLTALLPVTFPTDASAYWSCVAATLLAKVSEKKKTVKLENEANQLYILTFTFLIQTSAIQECLQQQLWHKNTSLTRKRSPQCYKDHCSDSVSQADGAPEMGG